MEKNSVLNGNKLIAEFMGTTYEKKKNTYGVVLYEVSWDWLMPVVQKIDDIICEKEYDKQGKQFDYYSIREYVCEFSLLYREVIKFIEWYNEQNK